MIPAWLTVAELAMHAASKPDADLDACERAYDEALVEIDWILADADGRGEEIRSGLMPLARRSIL